MIACALVGLTSRQAGAAPAGTETGTESGSASGTETSTGSGSASGTGTESGSATGTGSESGSATGTGSGSGSATGTGSGSGSATETGSGSATGTGSGSATGTESGSATGTESGSESGSATGTETGSESAEAAPGWAGGDHLTGEWGGARRTLADHGVTIDVIYASDVYTAHGQTAALGHVDAALTLDSHKLGAWDGGTLYVLAQNNHGSGINDHVGSAIGVSNLEAAPYTQLTELFIEQALADGRLRVRIGKQDANRDFGTPRFGGNFINNNFGMFPNVPLPSYPTTGLGAVVIAQPAGWLTGKLAVFEGSPSVGGLGLTSAFRDGGGYIVAGSAAITHHLGAAGRSGGTTSAGAWWQSDDIPEVGVADPRMFDSNAGWFVQHDERIYLHPEDPADPRGLTVIVRASASRSDRSAFPRYVGGSAAWHGLGPRTNDTAGIGAGYFTISEPTGGAPGPGSEWFVEAFYKLRLTSFVSLQPDLQWFRHPGGDGRDALAAGVRLKLKL
ncbi:MAG TPA: carbohydrate porin [Kofleriaceae bacterium]|nr:carbohydrate porin [Kofleriaceae bacterium]